MMKPAEEAAFAGATTEVIQAFRLELGVAFRIGDTVLSSYSSILYILLFMVIFFVLTLAKITRKQI